MGATRAIGAYALVCPGCGAGLDVPAGETRHKCRYCGGVLRIAQDRVSQTHDRGSRAQNDPLDKPTFAEPDATLVHRDAPRFEMSLLEQLVTSASAGPPAPNDRYDALDLGGDAFALVSLRAVTTEGKPFDLDLSIAFDALQTSLEEDRDPGLAANLALDALSERGFVEAIECAILLFEPAHMTMTAYNAGCNDSLLWVSQEEGRTIVQTTSHARLERRMLREARDHFANDRPVRLSAGDLVMLLSAGAVGRGARSSSSMRSLLDVTNKHIGEAPLRIITLAKNAFWESRTGSARSEAPVGDIRMAAVRARLPPLASAETVKREPQLFRSRRFEMACLTGPRDHAEIVPLHGDRQVVLWFSPALDSATNALDPEIVAAGRAAVLAVLDRPDHGDNENPRRAGREAYEAMKLTSHDVRMSIVQMLDEHGRVKYFRAGWKQPLLLGPRKIDDHGGLQAFDEGGEVTVEPGARLFFPGPLMYEGQPSGPVAFSETWPGGKASRLYEAFRDHWKTKQTARALEKLSLAAASDQPASAMDTGLALVSQMP